MRNFTIYPFVFVGVFLAALGAWLTHMVWVIVTLASDAGITAGQIVLAIMGTVVPPFGVVHGVLIWFGFGL